MKREVIKQHYTCKYNILSFRIEMTDNSDKMRALRAEKQVERLERELELIKSRIKASFFFSLINKLIT
jgi:hypothetical protein